MSGVLTTAAVALGVLAFVVVHVSPASANGIHAGSREVFAGGVGPYFMRVTTAPFVGTMHFVVFLAQADEVKPVEGAEIALWGRSTGDAEPESVGPVAGVASLEGPNIYTVDVPVSEIGGWLFTVSVQGSLGEEVVDIPLTVARRGSVNLGVVGILLVLVVLVGLVALSWGRKRRRRRVGG